MRTWLIQIWKKNPERKKALTVTFVESLSSLKLAWRSTRARVTKKFLGPLLMKSLPSSCLLKRRHQEMRSVSAVARWCLLTTIVTYSDVMDEKVFSNEDKLFEHEDTTHPLMCHICYNFFKDKDSKLKHFMENHSVPNQPNWKVLHQLSSVWSLRNIWWPKGQLWPGDVYMHHSIK